MAAMTEAEKDSKYGPIVMLVNSQSDADTKWPVRRHPDGTLSCKCKGWTFNRDVPKHCKHTEAAAKNMNLPQAAFVKRPVKPIPQVMQEVHAEAESVARSFMDKARTIKLDELTAKVEAAIKKFMSTVVDSVASVGTDIEMDRGVRLITLEE